MWALTRVRRVHGMPGFTNVYVYALQADVAGGILMMRAPAGRGLVAIGNAAGQLVLADPRAGFLPNHLALSS